MKQHPQFIRSLAGSLLGLLLLPAASCLAGHYTNFEVSVYGIGAGTDPARWANMTNQLQLDKVYVEVQRDRRMTDEDSLENAKKFYQSMGVKVAGGMALSDSTAGGQFRSFCYTDPADRDFIKSAAQRAARHFDEVIQDDFFFITTKYPSDIAAKGDRTWTQFRLDLERDAAKNLLVGPAKEINPKIKMVIKYPNWYEHFQGLGYDLDQVPKIFDGLFTGTETRDPDITDQNLQSYESYLIMRYFENIAPGRNGGGWVDTGSLRYSDRFAEQLVDTVFAKAREMLLFGGGSVTGTARAGERPWADQHTSFDYNALQKSLPDTVGASVTWGRIAGDALTKVDAFLGQMGTPIGIKSYKPYQSTGEDFLHDYLGMIGIPIDLYPYFPTNASTVLLTECAKFDPDIVAKIKAQLLAGKSVVITSGLLRALQGKGIEDIAEIQYSDHKVLSHEYSSSFGQGSGSALAAGQVEDVLFPEIFFLTNDSWQLLRAMANGRGYPLLLMNRYGREGVLYVWTMPENFNDLYKMPQSAVSTVKNYVMAGFPIRVDGPDHVALFAYDNNTCIVESFRPTPCDVRVTVGRQFTKLRNLATGEVLAAAAAPAGDAGRGGPGGRGDRGERGGRGGAGAGGERGGRGGAGGGGGGGGRGPGQGTASFSVHLLPHSYSAFIAEP
jgi:hypothetical protein